ncbi:MAG: hypothetical protein K1X78_27330 [Verrucomicrobiaceae bacterium]|nr:hypothetical protein [Verrucomicrobiaceae bacterium]
MSQTITRRRLLCSVLALLIAIIGWGAYWFIRQQRDKIAVHEYITRIQPQLAADGRFAGVRLLGYSCDYVSHPYIPVSGHVRSQSDWDALQRFIQESKAPAFITVRTVAIHEGEVDSQKRQ